MSFDDGMAQRIREALEGQSGIIEKKMFGGLAFMIHGNMSVGVMRTDIMVRVGPDKYIEALAEKGAREMDFTGKPLKGFVYVEQGVLDSDKALLERIDRGREFALSLPAK